MSATLSASDIASLRSILKKVDDDAEQVSEKEIERAGKDLYLEGDCPPAFAPCDPTVMNCPKENLATRYIDQHGRRCFDKYDIQQHYRKYTEPSTQELHSEMLDLTTMIARAVRTLNYIKTNATQNESGKYEISAEQVCNSVDDERFCGSVPFGKDQIQCAWQNDKCGLKGASVSEADKAQQIIDQKAAEARAERMSEMSEEQKRDELMEKLANM